jgi:hypothetical protein
MPRDILPAVEFQSLPLEFVIASPLAGAVKAQALAAANTRDFITAFKDEKVTLKAASQIAGDTRTVDVDVPLLAVVPIPHLRIDSLTVNFKYEISQISVDRAEHTRELTGQVGTAGILSNFVQASFKGSVASKSSSESTLNRAGSLDITVHASEAEMPEGLKRVLSLLAHAVPSPTTLAAPAPVPAPAPGAAAPAPGGGAE